MSEHTAPEPGVRDLGPADGDLTLRTTTAGAMAKMGHELTIVAEQWHVTVVVGESAEASSLRVTVDLGSLRVRDAVGGAKPMAEAERPKVEANLRRALRVDQHRELSFGSTAITGDWSAGRVDGGLTVNGHSAPQGFLVERDGEAYRLTGIVTQSRFGITPFSTMMGALKVGDDVQVAIAVRL